MSGEDIDSLKLFIASTVIVIMTIGFAIFFLTF